MTEVVFGVPGDLATATGGYAYARKVIEKLERPGLCVRHLQLPAGFPDPTESDLAETLRLVDGLPSRAVLLIDGLAYGAMPAPVIAKFARPVVALVHHPLCLELGLTPARRAELRRVRGAGALACLTRDRDEPADRLDPDGRFRRSAG